MGAGASASTADANDQADGGGNDQAADHVAEGEDAVLGGAEVLVDGDGAVV